METVHGSVRVTMCGTPRGNRPAILTYHDIGLNREYPPSIPSTAPGAALPQAQLGEQHCLGHPSQLLAGLCVLEAVRWHLSLMASGILRFFFFFFILAE